jgi:alpha-mannosidase
MRISLGASDPFLRVDLAVRWSERRKLLRMESWLAVDTHEVTYGAPHGIVHRSARRDTPAERAKYEVPGQRYAFVRDARNNGVAVFALDTYGWSARALTEGGIALGHSLLRSATWPDPSADLGEHRLSWAFAPVAGAPIGAIERAWESFACESRVRLFDTDHESIQIAACKIAEDGDGVIVRLRECDGADRAARIRCGARMRDVHAVDALERPIDGSIPIEGESFVAAMPAYGLRAFRVRF